MSKVKELEKQLIDLEKGGVLDVSTPRLRDAAHRIALRNGLKIITRWKVVGKGYQIFKR